MQVHSTAAWPSALIQHRLRPLFMQQLESMYAGLHELSQLRSIESKSVSAEFRKLLSGWFQHLRKQMIRMEEVFALLVVKPTAKADQVFTALVQSLKKTVSVKRGKGSDVALIIELSRTVHNNIACFHSMEQLASSLGMEETVNLMHQALEDEKDWDPLLEDLGARLMNAEP